MRKLFLIAIAVLTAGAEGRVLPHAPLTESVSVIAAYHHRGTRHFAQIEDPFRRHEVVLYDSTGVEPPRVLVPPQPAFARMGAVWVALWEDERGVPSLLVVYGSFPSGNPIMTGAIFSNDGGRTWVVTALPRSTFIAVQNELVDNGGPFTRGRFSPVRIGNREFPFVVYDSAGAIWRVDSAGRAEKWLDADSRYGRVALLASDATGTVHLVRNGDGTSVIAAFDGRRFRIPSPDLDLADGWIAPDFTVYLEETSDPDFLRIPTHDAAHALWMFRHGEWQRVFQPSAGSASFAVPTHDYAGAWIVERARNATDLFRHTPAGGLVRMWSDPSAPVLEAVHAAPSGKSLLLQFDRPRITTIVPVHDVRLALWRVGEPLPSGGDDLYVGESNNRGFVHLDVDRAVAGEPFVFGSGNIVRASLRQQLVLPGVGHTQGANGSRWSTDVLIHNPHAAFQSIQLRYVDADGSTTIGVDLAPHQVVVLGSVVATLFRRTGRGTLFLTPERSINATSRTYSRSGFASYGYEMPAVDIHTAASPRFPAFFPVTFAAPPFRSSVTLVDTTGLGAEVVLTGAAEGTHVIPPGGQIQVATDSGLGGGLTVRPTRGFVIGSVFAVDNETNDAMWIPPGGPAGWLPSIGAVHTDLHLYNPTADFRTIYMDVQSWTAASETQTRLTLPPRESMTERDAQTNLFAEPSSQAHLFFTGGVRVLARYHRPAPNGGTFGHAIPPLDHTQIAEPGDTLEILGVHPGTTTRTNLGIVELNNPAAQTFHDARIEIIDRGRIIDSFVVNLRQASGIEINDLFATRRITDVSGPLVIRISPLRGAISAYATVVDTVSGDSIYLAPTRA